MQTALHRAAWCGCSAICHTLVEAGASLILEDYQGNTPYYKAKQSGDRELADYLKSKGEAEKCNACNVIVFMLERLQRTIIS